MSVDSCLICRNQKTQVCLMCQKQTIARPSGFIMKADIREIIDQYLNREKK